MEQLQRRKNCGCATPIPGVPTSRPALQRRANKGTYPARSGAYEPPRPGFWTFDEWDLGWATAAILVTFGVALAEGIRIGKENMRSTPAP